MATIGAGVGTYLGLRSHLTPSKNASVPTNSTNSTPSAVTPLYNNTGISMVAAYNKAFKTYYDDSEVGFAALKQSALGDFTSPFAFADFACSGVQANISCTLSEALQGNSQQINLPLIIVDEDLRQTSIAALASCDSGINTTAQSFVAPLPTVAAGNTARGFFSVLISPDADCSSAAGAPLYDFHYTLAAGGQSVGANNSVVLFKYNAACRITNALIGVNQGERNNSMFFNEPIFNLQTSY